MKKIILALVFGLLVFAVAGSQVLAGGDKVRGEEGVGLVNQIQNEEPQCWDTSWCY